MFNLKYLLKNVRDFNVDDILISLVEKLFLKCAGKHSAQQQILVIY